MITRHAGVLCHPTSFYNQFGIGDLGPSTLRFLEFLEASGISHWQVLPLNPTGYGDSPYQSFSAYAGNPYLISPEWLVDQGILEKKDLIVHSEFPAGRVDFGQVIPWKREVLNRAYQGAASSSASDSGFLAFCEKHKDWLDTYALFMALKEHHDGRPWVEWDAGLRAGDESELLRFKDNYMHLIQLHQWTQYFYFTQWNEVRQAAKSKNIRIIGDVPIYVSHDSADVWGKQRLFYLDDRGYPTVVAGVPPDYFSPTGQLWGNPIYRWEVEKAENFPWWVSRMRQVLDTVDMVRLDHFRGFAGYWEVPGGEETAVKGRWVNGPGQPLFRVLKEALGNLPFIAEDLGEITEDVIELRDSFGLPGMKIFQFGFAGDPEHEFLPHRYPSNCVAYTGSHDNETLVGWYKNAGPQARSQALDYVGSAGDEIHWDMMAALWRSNAGMVVTQMQDILGIGDEGRMNFPGRAAGNWQWRLLPYGLEKGMADRLYSLNKQAGRLNTQAV